MAQRRHARTLSASAPTRGGGRVSGPTTRATLALDRAGIAYVRHAYDHDPATESYGLEAARALLVEPARVFKTLLVNLGTAAGAAGAPRAAGASGARLGVALVPVTGQLDLKATAVALGVKAVTMAQPVAAERSTGYVVGGISPLGQKRALPTVLDATAFEFATVFVSGGRRGFDLELSPGALLALTAGVRESIRRP